MPERLLTFERAGRAFALRAAEVAEIAADRPLETVPLAPSAIAGLSSERGRVITVIELDRMLRIRADPDGPSYLVMLAPPWSNLALRVRARVQLEDAGERDLEPEAIDIARLVESVEAVIATGAGNRAPAAGQ